MKKEILVFSLGGSLIVPDNVDYIYLKKFSKMIQKLSKKYKIIIVTGGGKTARNYITAIKKEKLGIKNESLVGIMSTKLNARLVAGFFKIKTQIPDSLQEIKKQIEKEDIIICGALGFQPNMTSDGDAAQISQYLKSDVFINLTNVNGLYDKDPKKYKDAKLISSITHKEFLKIVKKIKYESGQHFVLDQVATKIILKNKIKTLILNGANIKNINKCLSGDMFIGTLIS